jgi:amidase
MTEGELIRIDAAQQAELVRSGEVSARELVEASLAQIERANVEVGAFVRLCADRARREADAVRPGDPRSLCGVPIGIKDLLSATEGLATNHGSSAFGDWVADHDSAHVRRLRGAGAIVMGKTATPELGARPVTESARHGVTRNPWNLALSAGGSSGGSAAAVASGMVALADGSDMGGSIRIPASCCGVIGLKPSRGRVSLGPDYADVGLGTPADGVLTRTVLDAANGLDVIGGPEPGDKHITPPPEVPFADAIRGDVGRVRVRLARVAPLGVLIDPEPQLAAKRAADALEDLGHDVVESAPAWDDPGFAPAWSTFATGTMQHLVKVLERLHGRTVDPDALEPATRAWVYDSAPVSLVGFLEAVERLGAFSRELLADWPSDCVLVTPTLTRLPAGAGAIQAQAGVTDDAVQFSVLVRLWNVTGQPAISLPLHESDDGVPVGVQLVGAPGRDDLLLGLASQLESTIGFRPAARIAAPVQAA